MLKWPRRALRLIASLFSVVVTMPWNSACAGDCIDYSDYVHWVSTLDTPGAPVDVVLAGTYACVADSGAGLQVIDVSDAAAPSIVGGIKTPGIAQGVAVSSSFVFVADGESGLAIVDISTPSVPTLRGILDTPGSAKSVAVKGSLAAVADSAFGLTLIDMSNPTVPVIVGNVDTPGNALGVAIGEDYAVVADGHAGVCIVDISNPGSPFIVGAVDTPGVACDVAIGGDHAFIADGRDIGFVYGIQVIDVSIPHAPEIVGSLVAQAPHGAVLDGSNCYVADRFLGLLAIDVSNPSAPRLIGQVDAPQGSHGVAVANGYAYIANGELGSFRIADIRNPACPSVLAKLNASGYAVDVTTSLGNHVCLVDYDALHIIDVSTPDHPAQYPLKAPASCAPRARGRRPRVAALPSPPIDHSSHSGARILRE